MATRSINEGVRRWLVNELAAWQALGLVSTEQAAGILDLYGTPEEAAERRGARALFALTSLAALLVGLAGFLLVGYNWEAMPAALKMAIVVTVLLAAHALGFVLRERLGRRTASEIVFFLACLFYGASIWLVAQIFHINAGNADGYWWWAIGVLPFALCLDTPLLHATVAVLLALFAGFSVLGDTPLSGGPSSLLHLPPGGAYSVPLLALPGLLWAYRRTSSMTVALYVPLLAWWAILQPFAWKFEANPVYFVAGVGGLLLLIAECHEEESPLSIPFRFYGALVSVGALIPLSYHQFNRETWLSGGSAGVVLELVFVVAAGVAIVALAYVRRSRRDPTILPGSFLVQGRRLLPLGLILLMMLLAYWSVSARTPLLPTVLANVALVALAFWLMQLGLRDDRGFPFTAGVLLFLLWAVLRYIDLFGDFGGMLGAAGMFFLCGATLFGFAQYWRTRKVVRHA